jgi:hypothetical protein
MPPRKTAAKKPDPLGEVRVEVFAALGDTSLKAECPLKHAPEMAARLHDALETLVDKRPRLKPALDVVPGGDALYVWDDEDDGARRKGLGFAP